MKDSFDQPLESASLVTSGKLQYRPPATLSSGYSDGYLMLPPASPGKALLDRRYASSEPRLKTAPAWRPPRADCSWPEKFSGFSLDGESP